MYTETISSWKNGEITGNMGVGRGITLLPYIRKYIKDKYDNKCAECGWNKINPASGKSPLAIHHIDGNSTNSTEENLVLLCPNCHSLTDNFGSLNRGNGRNSYGK